MNKESLHYKAINFDLSIHQLEKYYSHKSPQDAYRDMKVFLEKENFSHRQYSGYRSHHKLSNFDVMNLIKRMKDDLDWIDKCARKMDITNITQQYDVIPFLKNNEII